MIPQDILISGAAYLVAINTATFAAFAWDKRQSRLGRRRFTEKGLIQMAALGGGIGGGLAMAMLRHKSNKPTFKRRFWNVFAAQMVLIVCAVIYLAVRGLAA